MYTIDSIIPFDMLVDTDMGLIKYIQFNFQGDDKYYPGIMSCVDPSNNEFLKTVLINRKFANPLSAIMKPEKMIVSKPDEMLDSFFRSSYDEILNLSIATAIFDMVCRSLFVHDTLRYTILCGNKKEEDFLRKKFKRRFKTDKIPVNIIIGEPETVETKQFDTIYIKDVHDIDRYFTNKPIPNGKNFIIAKYVFNKEFIVEKDEYVEIPLIGICNKYTETNKILFIDVYPVHINDKSVG